MSSGSTQIALLRGINVGTAKRVAMADLRTLAEALGFANVRTLLNSGNVVFTSPYKKPADAASRFEKGIAGKLGFVSRVTVLTGADLARIVSENPLMRFAKDPSRLMVSVLTDPVDRAKLEPLAKQRWTPEVFALGARVAYMWLPEGQIKSVLATSVSKALGSGHTVRNWATLLKLHAMASE